VTDDDGDVDCDKEEEDDSLKDTQSDSDQARASSKFKRLKNLKSSERYKKDQKEKEKVKKKKEDQKEKHKPKQRKKRRTIVVDSDSSPDSHIGRTRGSSESSSGTSSSSSSSSTSSSNEDGDGDGEDEEEDFDYDDTCDYEPRSNKKPSSNNRPTKHRQFNASRTKKEASRLPAADPWSSDDEDGDNEEEEEEEEEEVDDEDEDEDEDDGFTKRPLTKKKSKAAADVAAEWSTLLDGTQGSDDPFMKPSKLRANGGGSSIKKPTGSVSLAKNAKKRKAKPMKKTVTKYVKPIGSKTIVFAHHKDVMNAIQEVLRDECIKHVRIDGDTSTSNKMKSVTMFQEDNTTEIALLSLHTCGTGINLTRASVAIFAELDWSPGNILQAEDRIHRIGQKAKEVRILYLLGKGTSDEYM
jgi:hypothetical protein